MSGPRRRQALRAASTYACSVTGTATAPSAVTARSRSRWLVVGGATAVAGGAALLVAFPPGGAVSIYPPCPFKALTGLDCPFCGGLRATHALITGDLTAAADQNILVTTLWAAVAVGVSLAVWRRWRDIPPLDWAPLIRRAGPVLLAATAVFWVVRNLPYFPYLHSGAG